MKYPIYITYHISHIIYHISYITYHISYHSISYVSSQKSTDYCHLNFIFSFLLKQNLQFPINCQLASLIHTGQNNFVGNSTALDCCKKCEFPDFANCTSHNTPDWICVHHAIVCVSKCKCLLENQSVPYRKMPDLSKSHFKLSYKVNDTCKKTKCNDKDCSVCTKLNIIQKEKPSIFDVKPVKLLKPAPVKLLKPAYSKPHPFKG